MIDFVPILWDSHNFRWLLIIFSLIFIFYTLLYYFLLHFNIFFFFQFLLLPQNTFHINGDHKCDQDHENHRDHYDYKPFHYFPQTLFFRKDCVASERVRDKFRPANYTLWINGYLTNCFDPLFIRVTIKSNYLCWPSLRKYTISSLRLSRLISDDVDLVGNSAVYWVQYYNFQSDQIAI